MYISGKYKAKLEQFYVDKERGISITHMKAMGSILIKSVLPSNHRICHQHPRFMEDGSPFSLTLFIENLKTRFHLFLLTTNQSVLREKGEGMGKNWLQIENMEVSSFEISSKSVNFSSKSSLNVFL